MSCFFTLSLFIFLFHFFFHSPISPMFLFRHPCLVSTSYANRPVPYSCPHSPPSESTNSRYYHLSPYITLIFYKALFNILINMSQDKPEDIYCFRAHGPVVSLHTERTSPFKLFEISLRNLCWRSDMESPYARIAAKAFRIYIRIFSLFRNQ